MIIEVNNGGYIEFTEDWFGIRCKSYDENENLKRSDLFSEDEIIMTINLLRKMRDDGQQSVWLMNEETQEYLCNLIRNGDLDEFRIFQ